MSLSGRFRRLSCLLIFAGVMLTSIGLFAQNTISGELTGTVADPSGAVLSSVTVTLKSQDTAQTQTTTTTAAGFFRFALLRPGTYAVSATPAGFAKISREAVVSLGQVTNLKLAPSLAGAMEVMEVIADSSLLQTENANVTANFNQQQIANLPSPGNDMTNYALTAPGMTLSTGAGYGNFTAYGLPGTSNLFTVNGSDNNDPFNGLNNSGSSNNSLGTNELQEMTIVTNGYTAQYGRAAGANINYSTKSGTNQFHGNADWQWNGRVLNANDWFNNNGGTPRPFANSNIWAGSIGGPIKKDKVFFFYDNEGMRYVLPGGGAHYIPSPIFAKDTLANIQGGPTKVSAQLPFYQNFFKQYAGASGAGRAVPIDAGTDPALGCGDFTGTASNGGTYGTNVPCAYQFQGGNNNKNVERLMALKIDVIPTQSDKLTFRYWQDRGMQPTFTDAINPVFNASSNQPSDQGQFTYTKTLNASMVNQLLAAGSYYSAIFSVANRNAALAAFPTTFISTDSEFDYLGGTQYVYPQGRRVAQFQVSDDFSWTKGNHNFKFGANIRHDNITDLTPFRNTTGELELGVTSLFSGLVGSGDDGSGDQLVQRYTVPTEAGFTLYSLGMYAQDEWRVNAKLKLTLSLRADRNSNETCPKGCISRFAGAFTPGAFDTSYNQSILTGQKNGFPGVEAVVIEPRVGFAYSPWGDTTVFRGGIGLFSDLYPADIVEPFASNAPATTTFNIGPVNGVGTGSAVDYNSPNGLNAIGLKSDAALLNGFGSGQTVAQMRTNGLVSLPSMTATPNSFKNPKYLQWNFQIEQAFGQKTALTLNYVGNHGYDEVLQNPLVNAYSHAAVTPFAGIPSSAPDARFGSVNQYTNNGYSNYNGLTAVLSRRMSFGFTGSINYSWSHSLDTVSNGGVNPYNNNPLAPGSSILTQLNPTGVRAQNYASSDYDFRHNLSANYVWQIPYKSGNKLLNGVAGNWSLAGTVFARSGEPFSAYYKASSFLSNTTTATDVLASFLGGPIASCNTGNASCLSASQFALPGNSKGQPIAKGVTVASNDFGTASRNAFRGPKYFDTDLTATKKFKLTERTGLSAGVSFYNILNHPNFSNPSGNIASSFGKITNTATAPSSPYGNFQGAAVSGRIIQTNLKIEF